MILSVSERLVLLNSLPPNGDITTIRIIRKLREDLSFSEEEHKILNFVNSEKSVTWDAEAASTIEKDITIGEKAMDVIKQSLQEMDRRKLLNEGHIPVWERFMEVGNAN